MNKQLLMPTNLSSSQVIWWSCENNILEQLLAFNNYCFDDFRVVAVQIAA